jgi:hypothetical protein
MNSSFYRKVVYGCLIVLLWFPLSFIGRPVSVDPDGTRNGGKLTQLRDENSLSQATLGEIDPTSESMKLATLGMRNVAVTVLWTMANEYKRTEDFDNFAATVNQITLLAPNFISVWEFQAHNETYNVSVEYDAYRMRYAWVKKGIDLLIRGTEHNKKDTRLVNYLSWFFGQKIGRADEHKQFRELFRNDHDYHTKLTETLHMQMDDLDVVGPNRKDPDNWLVGRRIQLRAVNLVETQGVPIRGKSPVLFYADAPMLRINYSKAIEDEGWLGDVAGEAWRLSGNDWKRYGEQPVPTSWGHDIRLGEYERYRELTAAGLKKLNEEIAPGVHEKLLAERQAKLKPEERAALEIPPEKRTNQQMMLAMEAEPKLAVNVEEVANLAPAEKRREAKLIARQCTEYDTIATRIERYRDIVNFKYWRTRCEVEQSPTALKARQLVADATKKYEQGDIDKSKELYESAWVEWAKVYDKYPEMMDDVEADDLVDSIQRYRKVLSQHDIHGLPEDFPLRRFLEVQRHGKEVLKQEAAKPTEKEPMDKKPEDGHTKPAEPTDDTKKGDTEEPKTPESTNKKPSTDEPAATPPVEPKPDEPKPDDKTTEAPPAPEAP